MSESHYHCGHCDRPMEPITLELGGQLTRTVPIDALRMAHDDVLVEGDGSMSVTQRMVGCVRCPVRVWVPNA